ncbi:hypothetical protein M301_2247 [Methylotenera versatilis 301]|jgi:hypothetical protein|uniref:Uncharacterized protein n=1 Tax=Methylotenera versatilis (strain 301) TaxID=666681 RepID=D7DLE1_METV0|nr:hypothetical protein M301_2247 [Methylotenera versatilis 301]
MKQALCQIQVGNFCEIFTKFRLIVANFHHAYESIRCSQLKNTKIFTQYNYTFM